MKNAIYVYFQYQTLNKVPLRMKEHGYEPKLLIDGEYKGSYDEKYGIEGIHKYVITTQEQLYDNSIYITPLMEEYLAKNIFMPNNIEKIIRDNIPMLIDQSSRWNEYFNKTYYDYLNYIYTMARFAYIYMTEENIDVIFFTHFCHLGIDLTFYLIAKELGIKTIFMNPEYEIETGKYLISYSDTQDYEKLYDKMVKKRRDCTFQIKDSFEKPLTYMKNIKLFTLDNLKLKWPILFKMMIYSPFYSSSHPKTKYIYRTRKYFQEKACILYRDSIIKPADFSSKYVYFGLHLQPELTTSFYGGIYSDQLLAIEKLSAILPDDWIIYVKENPKQNLENRGRIFYERLNNIPKVQLVPMDTNTYDLIKHSQFNASITGTLLYESVCGGKPALMFGNYWYSRLPGVTKYRDGLTVDEIVNCEINHNELQNIINDFYSKCIEIVIENNMLEKLVPEQNYDIEENHNKVVNLLCEMMNE